MLAVLLLAIALYPASAPHAAATQADPQETASPAPAEAASFGAATPTEKFIQTFQQQVSQQMQATLAQSSEAQESRLRAFEQQQHDLDARIQALDQAVAATRTAADHPGQVSGGGPAGPFAEVEAPRVNFRKAGDGDPGGESNPDTASGPLSGLLSGTSPGSLAASLRGLDAGSGAAGPGTDDHAFGRLGSTTDRVVRGDANVAPHGFIEGRLLNGVVTQQGGPERESIVALTGDYQSANGFTADLDGCFALVQGRPEIATGRIDFKLSRLTCNFHDGASRTWDASGWLVDADGIRGVRAVIVDNTGKKVAVAAGGGAIGGIGQRISQQQYEISGGPAGFAPSTSFAGSAGRDALGGAASGAASALGQSITDYYNLYAPSLQVGGGTHVTVVLANDLRLPRSGRDISRTHTANP